MNFIHSSITWAFFLVLVPLLIHLINMMRHRRVKWAAMEFLLASYKKHRKWIWLKQLLLLLLRMAAVAAVVAIMAQWIPPDRWAKLFGGKVTHHYVLLDDSFSMGDRAGDETAFDRARAALEGIIERASSEETVQKITVIPYSMAAARAGHAAALADLSDQIVGGAHGSEQFDAARLALGVTQLAVGPLPAVKLLDKFFGDQSDESRIVYILSDFRAADWENPAALDQRLRAWEQAGAAVHLIDCVSAERPNLAVTRIAPTEATRSAGVPLRISVTVKNLGSTKAEDVELTVTSFAYESYNPARHGDDPAAIAPAVLDERSETIESLAPGEAVTRQVQVRFPDAGKHVVEASLPDDALAVDNRRYCVVDFPDGEPVLIVDGHPENRNAYFLSAVFQPRVRGAEGIGQSTVRTGIVPTIAEPADLNGMPPERLHRYRAVYLLDAPRLDEAAVAKLETYVRDGGGLAIFLGDDVLPTHYNQRLYAGGKGLLPMPLGEMELLTLGNADDDERLPDFEVVDHPVLSLFASGDPAFRRGVVISTFYTAKPGWKPPAGSAAKILATLRDKAKTPWIVEQPFGAGRVMLFNTTAAPLWNNWARGQGGGPSFVVTMLMLHAYIAAPMRADESLLVGAPLSVEVPLETFQQEAEFIVPQAAPISRKPVAAKGAVKKHGEGQAETLQLSMGPNQDDGKTGYANTDREGIYEIWAAKKSGEFEVQRFALNVDPDEGQLARVSGGDLAKKMQARFDYHAVGDLQFARGGQSTSPISEVLLYVLIGLLVGEQLLAYSASYHPSAASSGVHLSARGATR